MPRTCIAIVDASRARLFAFDRTSDETGIHEELVEQTDMVNPARRRRPSQLFSDTRPGTARGGGRAFEYDDHRDAHIDHFDSEFARAIADEITRALAATGAHRLIVCASPRMLGALRVADLRKEGVVIDELPRDLVKLTSSQLRDALAANGMLPEPPPRAALASH